MSIPGTQASRPEGRKEGRKEIVALGRGRGWRLLDVVINSLEEVFLIVLRALDGLFWGACLFRGRLLRTCLPLVIAGVPGGGVWRALAEISVGIHGYFGYLYPWFS